VTPKQFQLQTQGGYQLQEVISALQKTIRRGLEEEAMYWALELVPKFEKYLWKRLIVIANEDVGIAAPSVLHIVPTQRDVYMEFRKDGKDGGARLALANTILLMCRSPKTRLADEFQCAINQRRLQNDWKQAIPDYALDKHTNKGRAQKRSWRHFFEEGTKLEGELIGEEWQRYRQAAFSLWPHMKKPTWGRIGNGIEPEENEDQSQPQLPF